MVTFAKKINKAFKLGRPRFIFQETNLNKIAIALLLATTIAAPAFAESRAGKIYFSADVGQATFYDINAFPNPGMARIAGGYQVSPVTAFEAAYTRFENSRLVVGSNATTISASSVEFAWVASLPLNRQFDLIARVGTARNNADTISTSGSSVSTAYNVLVYGVGVQYHWTSNVAIRFQYVSYGRFENTDAALKAAAASLGVGFNF